MQDDILNEVESKILKLHEGDEKQLEIVFSNKKRIIVEAPAGFGKTTTMISRIAFLYALGQIPNPKRLLALTFSVNAALKIKRDIASRLPLLLQRNNNPVILKEKMHITNYHGFCKGILSKYGYLLSDFLRKDVNLFYALGDVELFKKSKFFNLNENEVSLVQNIDKSVSSGNMPSNEDMNRYSEMVIKKLLFKDHITHNAIILFTIKLFQKYESIRRFYSSYYPFIIVDEFQDTNCIAWNLLESIISADTEILFLGDPLQRIYGFIGALPNLMDDVATKYSMKKVNLERNYRFRGNLQMLRLDQNIRLNVKSKFSHPKYDLAEIPTFYADSMNELQQIVCQVKSILSNSPNSKIAFLFRNRKSVDSVERAFKTASIDYFYGMFTDDDQEYVRFNNRCRELLIDRCGNSRRVSLRSIHKFVDDIQDSYESKNDVKIISLNRLLHALVKKITENYNELSAEEKYNFLLDIFENRQLKQAMEYVDSSIILSTIHGAKGLEWDYVFVMDFETRKLPNWSVCRACSNEHNCPNGNCLFPDTSNPGFRHLLLDELAVFYVAVTRAKKQVYFFVRRNETGGNSGKFSCFTLLPGIKLIDVVLEKVGE